MSLETQPSNALVLAHLALGAALAGGLVFGIRQAGMRRGEAPARAGRRALASALVLAAWLGGTWALARSGWLLEARSAPPRMLFVLGPGLAACAVLAWTRLGLVLIEGLPLSVLVGFQGFRIGVELVLWRLHVEGCLPVRMTFEGANLDILSGASALVVARLCARGACPRALLWIWNLGALALLANIVTIAVHAMPGPWHVETGEPANTIVLHTVFVWIPALYVLAAWFGHVLVFRALLRGREAGGTAA